MDDVSFCVVGDNLANENTLAYADFDVVNTNSNHTYDTWTDSILNAQEAWASYPNITVIGSYASEQDRQNVRTVEKNGITIAFLSYSYGQNGYTQSQLPNDYYAVPLGRRGHEGGYGPRQAEGDVDTVYLARDYTDDMASANELLADLDSPGEWIRSKTSEVIGSEFQIDQ